MSKFLNPALVLCVLAAFVCHLALTDAKRWKMGKLCAKNGKCPNFKQMATSCRDGSEPVTKFYRCDGVNDCTDGSDEDNCKRIVARPFTCKNGNRLPLMSTCNGCDNCGDGSDETDCETCRARAFKCDNKHCIARSKKCNGKDDCGDNSDERGCQEVTICPRKSFKCEDGEKCISKRDVCNGKADCSDTSDERLCGEGKLQNRRRPHCNGGKFRCDNGKCIAYPFRCDGTDQCGDMSDERRCIRKRPVVNYKEVEEDDVEIAQQLAMADEEDIELEPIEASASPI